MKKINLIITTERIEAMKPKHYLDLRSAIAGFAIEENQRLFAFYVDGTCKVIEFNEVEPRVWLLILDAAENGYGLEFLMDKYLSWFTIDESRLAIAYLDCLTYQRS